MTATKKDGTSVVSPLSPAAESSPLGPGSGKGAATGEKYHQAIMNSLQEPILVIDREFRIVDSNNAARQIYGDGDGIAGRACFEVTHKVSVPCHMSVECPVRAVFAHGQQVKVLHEHHHANGRTVWEEVLASPLKDEHGEVQFVVEEMRDLTDILKNQRLVEELQSEVKTLHGLLPICSHCKRIRDGAGHWHNLEEYISGHTDANFTHGICSDCLKTHYPELGESDPRPATRGDRGERASPRRSARP